MSKIKSISVTNLKAISSLSADFAGATAIITGKNNSGKSTFLRSLPDRIRGIKPDVVVKFGESEGRAEWTLTTGEQFIWQVDTKSAKGEKLTFITKDQIKTSVTKEIAARFFPPVFDVDKFLTDGPKEQMVKVEKLAGIDLTEIKARYKSAYDDRTYANRKQAEETAKMTQVDLSLPETETPIDDLQKELAGIDAHNMRFNQVADGVKSKAETIEENNTEIERLRGLITALETKNTGLQQDITKGNEWMAADKNKIKPASLKTEIEAKIKTITDTNKKIVANNLAREQVKKVTAANEAAEDADALVKSIEQEKLDLIKNAKLPEGFGFNDDGLTYTGLPFTREQISSSAIYIAALKLAVLTLGEVRMLHFDASFLDKNSLADIERWAQEQDLQLLVERPDFEAGEIKYELVNQA